MTNHADHTLDTSLSGPDENSARRAKRWAMAGAAALLLVGGGVGAAYAMGGGGETRETGYATIVESDSTVPAEGNSVRIGGREDCPEKSGGETPDTSSL
ncbi:hypothetical protein N802_14450 [Knoellia sinensis KCTC 19936]|uniref:Uncharacterized protein n=1 Tax=Knoellia sinensis KCTC 19936 TaxID=1385520 RepID=A0A0A0JCN4_9MICO|nr:hypothetical protein [Knoellia sinensis]KGN33401.1 hypothetical protein N802_14450 [Knoellia sinensis KCTC 19936]